LVGLLPVHRRRSIAQVRGPGRNARKVPGDGAGNTNANVTAIQPAEPFNVMSAAATKLAKNLCAQTCTYTCQQQRLQNAFYRISRKINSTCGAHAVQKPLSVGVTLLGGPVVDAGLSRP